MTILSILKDVLAAIGQGLKNVLSDLFYKLQNWFISKALDAQKGQVSDDTKKANSDAADFLADYAQYKQGQQSSVQGDNAKPATDPTTKPK